MSITYIEMKVLLKVYTDTFEFHYVIKYGQEWDLFLKKDSNV